MPDATGTGSATTTRQYHIYARSSNCNASPGPYAAPRAHANARTCHPASVTIVGGSKQDDGRLHRQSQPGQFNQAVTHPGSIGVSFQHVYGPFCVLQRQRAKL
ncbi:hypothetical protein EV182_001264 [Spiromyces aspiralis]|uniref:Uncharacterized protein n=1 Tax=Spiromyces aspiralis TaxID=68401 RepID=A0ACC1HI60_9FUNG|nr:hypothetical protein EV182_001264 [Spiromyces aspiralis]